MQLNFVSTSFVFKWHAFQDFVNSKLEMILMRIEEKLWSLSLLCENLFKQTNRHILKL